MSEKRFQACWLNICGWRRTFATYCWWANGLTILDCTYIIKLNPSSIWFQITFLCKWVPVDGAWCFTSIGREKGLCLYSVAWRLLIPRGIPAELIVICDDWGWVWVVDTSEGKISWSIKLLPIVRIGMALVSSSLKSKSGQRSSEVKYSPLMISFYFSYLTLQILVLV